MITSVLNDKQWLENLGHACVRFLEFDFLLTIEICDDGNGVGIRIDVT